ncbi:pentatricopeptide repeat-containing protein At5g13770, chloroplastic-like [Cicer arietinum]|uniref:Pentatricopeptide repeat-containing protein At5g13770, chloroplastic-like n=1 Tax=Cicer arietinum TaxID=3827 RepID=A0A1S2Z986_CICAR|nr:pentatricopeptide repeat-containing protein At5g13770, chloroplastic-like [Cicer arietinum]XP_004517308.1 pentatricopeptide repeat-containing protein At5g13770, chloroplastic-like [Cicer arietinum]
MSQPQLPIINNNILHFQISKPNLLIIMAISCSSDWSLACTNCSTRRTNLHAFIPSFSSLSTSNPKFFIANLSASHTPILEEPSSNTPLIHLDVNNFSSDPQQYSKLENDQNLNDFLCGLFEDQKKDELAFDYYQRLKERSEFIPKKSTLKYVIRYLMKFKKWEFFSSLSHDFKVYHVFPDVATCSRLISFCIKNRKFKISETLLDAFSLNSEVGVFAFGSALESYNKLHMFRRSVLVYEKLKSTSVVIDARCYLHIMEAYLRLNNCERVVQLFNEFESRKLRNSNRYLGQIYSVLCESLGKFGRAFEALEYFRDMNKKGVFEYSIYSTLICSFARLREVHVAEELLVEAKNKTMIRDPEVYLKLVLMYVEEGLLEKTLEVVEAMKDVNVKVSDCVLCAIINGFSKRRGFSSSVKVFEKLIFQGYEPGQVTYASIINAYIRLGQNIKAEKVFSEMEQKGFDKCVVAYSSMIVMYGKTGRLSNAMRLVAKMKERGCKPNVWIYNSLIDMHGKEKNLRQLEKLWKEMKRRKVAPDKITYTSIIGAYCKIGEFDKCIELYNEYRLNKGVIDKAMAGTMVGVYSKVGQVDELVKLLQDMKSEGTRLDQRLYQSAWNAFAEAGMQVQVKWMKESFHVT